MKNQIELDLEENAALEELFLDAAPGNNGKLKSVEYTIVDYIPGKSVTMNVESVAGNDTTNSSNKQDDQEESEPTDEEQAVLNAIAS